MDIRFLSILKRDKLHFESAKCLKNIADTVYKSLKILKCSVHECNNAIFHNVLFETLDKEKKIKKKYKLSLNLRKYLKPLIKLLYLRSVISEQFNTFTFIKFHKAGRISIVLTRL